jgi:hypothetical protein
MKIKNIKVLRHYIAGNSTFSPITINNVISALGFSLTGSWDSLKELSAQTAGFQVSFITMKQYLFSNKTGQT